MKTRSQMLDGFEKSVAEKMPKIRKFDESLAQDQGAKLQPSFEDESQMINEMRPSEEEERLISSRTLKAEIDQGMDVFKLIEDLHNQLLASDRIKKALEMDLHSQRKTIQQLTQDNQELRNQLEGYQKELQKLRETQLESIYLKEENEDALERIQSLQQDLREMKETLEKIIQEKNEAIGRIQELQSQLEEQELLQIRGRLKEREAIHFYEENQKLQLRLEEVLAQNIDLERKYENLKKSFNEVRESLLLLRDSCKREYYNLSEP